MGKASWGKALVVGIYFGIAQAAMPLIGYFLGTQFAGYISSYDHWIAFVILGVIGGKMIKDSFSEECEVSDNSLRIREMLPLAVATSIDALAVGVSFAFLRVQIWIAAAIIGVITLSISMIGVRLGGLFGEKGRHRAELLGGAVLVFLGIKILVEHLAGS